MRYFLIILFLLTGIAYAQPEFTDLQNDWMNAIGSEKISGMYSDRGSLIYFDHSAIDEETLAEQLKGGNWKYSKVEYFRHDLQRNLVVGELSSEQESFLIASGWIRTKEGWKKAIDIILPKGSATAASAQINSELDVHRKEWVRLANLHDPLSHVSATYTSDATYFGAGQLSQGHDEIAERYFYMENENYQVDLEAVRLWSIDSERVYEVGRYFTGSERQGSGGLYTILWERTEEGKWLINLDFNY
jgi:ketosteroid isomerase-like protein